MMTTDTLLNEPVTIMFTDEHRFFICNFSEFFEEDSNNLFIFKRLAGYGEFGCGRRPR